MLPFTVIASVFSACVVSLCDYWHQEILDFEYLICSKPIMSQMGDMKWIMSRSIL